MYNSIKPKANVGTSSGETIKIEKTVSKTDRETDLKLTRVVKSLISEGFPINNFGLVFSIRYKNILKNSTFLKLTPQTGIIEICKECKGRIPDIEQILNKKNISIKGSEYNKIFGDDVILLYVSLDNCII